MSLVAVVTARILRESLDYEWLSRYLEAFLRESLERAGARGYVLGLSGGVDSSTLYALAVRALGAGRVVPVMIPDSDATPPEDLKDAQELAEAMGGRLLVVELDPVISAYSRVLERAGVGSDRLALGNLKARARMGILYYIANKTGMLVAGSTDRTELLTGYFTKHGDGASDVAPLTVVYKTQVRELARFLGVPERIAGKPSAPRLWRGHTAEEELGLPFDVIDPILFCYADLGMSEEEAARATGADASAVRRVVSLVERSRHKREPPRSPDARVVVEAVKRALSSRL
ncbi:MAG: NAD+ synthase [Acidilobaceae archaeon]